MIGVIVGYAAGKAVQRSRHRMYDMPSGYEEFKFTVMASALAIGAAWPLHLAYKLTQWGLSKPVATTIASLAGFLGAMTGAGYIVIGILYSGVWLGVLIERGSREEEAMDCRYSRQCSEVSSWE